MTAFELDDHLPADYLAEALRADVRAGLTAQPKHLPPKWFYDEYGGKLFDRITELPEYYPTRAEREILTDRAAEVAERTGAGVLVELGAGSADKTRVLISALRATGTLDRYVPVDVNRAAVAESGRAVAAEYPGLAVHGVVADFEKHLDRLPGHEVMAADPDGHLDRLPETGAVATDPDRHRDRPPAGPRLTAFLGGTVGNLTPASRRAFFRGVRAGSRTGDWFLLGADLVKDPAVLVPAYDDAEGITATFNRNVLRVVNRELRGDFDPDGFDHVAVWNAEDEWVEMWLRSRRATDVRIAELDLSVHFAAGESMRTEISAKFRRAGIEAELTEAGLAPRGWWTDRAERFSVTLAEAV